MPEDGKGAVAPQPPEAPPFVCCIANAAHTDHGFAATYRVGCLCGFDAVVKTSVVFSVAPSIAAFAASVVKNRCDCGMTWPLQSCIWVKYLHTGFGSAISCIEVKYNTVTAIILIKIFILHIKKAEMK